MITESVKAVQQQEEAGRRQLENARQKAQEILSEAKRDAIKLLEKKEDELKLLKQRELDKHRQILGKSKERIKAETEAEIEKLRKTAESRREKAVQAVISKFKVKVGL
ncbi:hypothetical protein J4475_03480 [Candidatus Woesearchaeota archaeon]|nr:hypothetical protein [Candidatus Woesearchaeota archaeon]